MEKLLSIILPVIDQMNDSHIKSQLLNYFPLQEEKLEVIENSFIHLTERKQDKEVLNLFFKSLGKLVLVF